MKKTLILGASTNPSRYAYLAAEKFHRKNLPFELLGNKKGEVFGHEIETETSEIDLNIDTVTMYLGADNQKPYTDFLIKLKPKRVIFNPGAENPLLSQMLEKEGIEVIEACTLVMLSTGQY
jgi:uncharacterized protein